MPLAGPGDAGVPYSTAPNSFVLAYVSAERHPCRSSAPPNPHPIREILDPQLYAVHLCACSFSNAVTTILRE